MSPVDVSSAGLFTRTFYLAFTAWREARGESERAQLGVMFCLVNRAAKPGWWGHTIDEVATKKWQFSSLTDPRDPQLTTWPLASDPVWGALLEMARRVMAADYENPFPGADSYFDSSIPAPAWTAGARSCGVEGRLSFWDVDHDYQAGKLQA